MSYRCINYNIVSALLFTVIVNFGFLTSRLYAAEDLDEIVVIGITPSGRTGLPETKIPYHVQSASGDDLDFSQSLDITDFLNRNIGSITINEALNNPLQPDVQYRGFTASPLLGLAQGIAVHQNGIRINEPLGDTVNWDLLPASAIHSINLIGGANPLFGLNTLGGSLSIDMKDGFSAPGHHLNINGGSFKRIVTSIESGNNNGTFSYYGNIHYFNEDGWRDQSGSDALNFYGNLGWHGQTSELDLNFQHGFSELFGNGPLPVELLALDREAVFTAPDITENKMYMFSADFNHTFTKDITFTGNGFYRRNSTDSFNGDASEFSLCKLINGVFLLEGIEQDELEVLGLDEDDICENNILIAADPVDLETILNAMLAPVAPGSDKFNINDLTDDLSGTGILADTAINNISDRNQQSFGTDLQLTFASDLMGHKNQLIVGLAYFKGESKFNSRLELAEFDPVTRSTLGLGTGTFVDEDATKINTVTETYSFYFTDTIELNDRLAITLSGRLNDTRITLADQSGNRPELNGEHDFSRFNPAIGITYQATKNLNLYAGYSESSRAPTPIELSCNDSIFDLAIANAIMAGEDPDDVDFECRLPNAFLADPPMQQVIARSFEIGARGNIQDVEYHLGFFHTTNEDDIIFQTTGRATGLFANVDETKRTGFESSFNGSWHKLNWFFSYSYIEATYEDNFDVISPNHPFANDDGQIRVNKGDSIPGIPKNQLKFGSDYYFNETFSIGLELIYNSGQVLRGDESNQMLPVNDYALINLRGRYRLNNYLEFFAKINNIFDSNYETFGLLGEEPNEVDIPLFTTFTNPRFLGPGAPRSAFIGIKLSL